MGCPRFYTIYKLVCVCIKAMNGNRLCWLVVLKVERHQLFYLTTPHPLHPTRIQKTSLTSRSAVPFEMNILCIINYSCIYIAQLLLILEKYHTPRHFVYGGNTTGKYNEYTRLRERLCLEVWNFRPLTIFMQNEQAYGSRDRAKPPPVSLFNKKRYP